MERERTNAPKRKARPTKQSPCGRLRHFDNLPTQYSEHDSSDEAVAKGPLWGSMPLDFLPARSTEVQGWATELVIRSLSIT
jgi:hypothetical protein